MRILDIFKKILIAAFIACVSLGTAIAVNGNSVKAAGGIPEDAVIATQAAPSLKINEDGGIRFVIKMNAAAKDYITSSDDISLVAFIGPLKLFEKTDEEIKNAAINLVLEKSKFYQTDGEDWYANACVIKMKEANLGVNYTAKACVMKGDAIEKIFSAEEKAYGNVYNIASRALLDVEADYTDKILAIKNYEWLGSENFPLVIDTLDKYNALVAKINGGAGLNEKYVEIKSSLNLDGATALGDGKALPQNAYKVSYVTFASETGETLATVKVKNGTAATYDGIPVKAEDDENSYAFDKWVTEIGGATEADLTAISGDTTVYASFAAKAKNAITEFTVADINYGDVPAFTAAAKHGTPIITYSKTEDGTYLAWNELGNRDAGTYYAKATVEGTDEYAAATSEVKQFTVKKLTDNAISDFVTAGEIACNETPAPTANAKYGEVKYLYSKFADKDFTDSFENAEYDGIGNYTYYVKAVVEETVNYNGAETDAKEFKLKHDFKDGVCSLGNATHTQSGILYAETDSIAYITGYDGNHSSEVYPVAVYNGKPVKYVATEAFAGKSITKVILPASVESLDGVAFANCAQLEYVSMTGVSDLTYNGSALGYGSDRGNNFINCTALRYVILPANFTSNSQQFFKHPDAPENPILDVYVDAESGAPKFEQNWNLLTGNIFYKGDATKCGQWNFDEKGEIKSTSHNFVNGVCDICGKYSTEKTQGVNYEYNEKNDCYYVGANRSLNVSELTILGTYNDGIHGEKQVKYVENKAFADTAITKVILPASVESLNGEAFANCTQLVYVSMIGVTNLNYNGSALGYASDRGNNFMNCTALRYVILPANFTSDCQQFFAHPDAPANPILNVYVNAESGEPKFAQNWNLLTGNIFYKGDATKCGQWNFDENGDIKSTSHNYVDGVCTKCGDVQSKSVIYEYNATYDVYCVAGVQAGTAESELYIRAKYDDGKTVAYVKANAFNGNVNIKKVILPESVVSLESNAFWGCSNLEYVSMTGVKNLDYASPYGGEGRNNNFRDCFKLKVVITSTALTSNVGQFGTAVGNTPENPILDFYVYGESGAPALNNGAADADNLVSGRVYYYSETQAENCWHYVNGVATLW